MQRINKVQLLTETKGQTIYRDIAGIYRTGAAIQRARLRDSIAAFIIPMGAAIITVLIVAF